MYKRFAKGKGKKAEEHIDFTEYEPRHTEKAQKELKRHKYALPKDPIIDCNLAFVIPPILHAKILIGNELYNRLLASTEETNELKTVVKKWKLDVDRNKEGIIYSRFHGNDIKRLCKAIGDLKSVSSLPEYQKIIKSLEIFDSWCKLVSSTDTSLSDERCQATCCRVAHSIDHDCCATARLGECLDKVGGFGTSVLVHDILMHLGTFLWEHRMIGAVAEEGIEAVHSRLDKETEHHKKSKIESLKNALKWLGIDVLLSDSGLFDGEN